VRGERWEVRGERWEVRSEKGQVIGRKRKVIKKLSSSQCESVIVDQMSLHKFCHSESRLQSVGRIQSGAELQCKPWF
jgi:hypothetical protein